MPQTRFVLRHALEQGLRIILVVNKIDRPGARPNEVVDEVFDLMVELEASDAQLDFPVVYASAMNGYARFAPDDDNMDMIPLLENHPQGDPGSRLRAERPGGAADLHRRPFQLRRPHRRGAPVLRHHP